MSTAGPGSNCSNLYFLSSCRLHRNESSIIGPIASLLDCLQVPWPVLGTGRVASSAAFRNTFFAGTCRRKACGGQIFGPRCHSRCAGAQKGESRRKPSLLQQSAAVLRVRGILFGATRIRRESRRLAMVECPAGARDCRTMRRFACPNWRSYGPSSWIRPQGDG
jgi:hypothetical protein